MAAWRETSAGSVQRGHGGGFPEGSKSERYSSCVIIVDVAIIDADLRVARARIAPNVDAGALRRNGARSVSSSGAMEFRKRALTPAVL